MTQMMHVKGELSPSNPKAVVWGIGNRMETEITRHSLADMFNGPSSWANEEWKEGKVLADSYTETPGGRPAVMDFITRLYAFVTAPGIIQHGLQGEFLVTVTGGPAGPVVFTAKVKNGNVFYHEGNLAREGESVPFMEKPEGDQ
jgi:hypothetical protein